MHSTRLLALLAVAACGGSPSRTTATTPAPPPVSPPAPVAEPPAITRIPLGGTPGSNRHRWGTRFFELRTQGGATELRLHDVVSFQGVNMRPEDMPPDQHACSPWEPLPSTIPAIPAGTRSCGPVMAACDGIRAWLRSTAPAPTVAGHDPHYGRSFGACE